MEMNKHETKPRDLVETVRLFSILGREELEIEISHLGATFLKIAKRTYDGYSDTETVRQTDRLDLTRDTVLLLYTITGIPDVTSLWHIKVIISEHDEWSYHLLSEQDAFTFQRLITGYSPCGRFKNLFASALERRTFTRSTSIEVIGEVQLWWCQSPESGNEPGPPPPPLSVAQTERNTRGWSASSGPALRPTRQGFFVRRGPVSTDLNGREIVVAMRNPPPLLVLFGTGDTSKNGKELYQMWRVDSELLFLLFNGDSLS